MCVSLLLFMFCFFFFKQKTAYEMRISDWSSDVCSSDLVAVDHDRLVAGLAKREHGVDAAIVELDALPDAIRPATEDDDFARLGDVRFALARARPVALVAGIQDRKSTRLNSSH